MLNIYRSIKIVVACIDTFSFSSWWREGGRERRWGGRAGWFLRWEGGPLSREGGRRCCIWGSSIGRSSGLRRSSPVSLPIKPMLTLGLSIRKKLVFPCLFSLFSCYNLCVCVCVCVCDEWGFWVVLVYIDLCRDVCLCRLCCVLTSSTTFLFLWWKRQKKLMWFR